LRKLKLLGVLLSMMAVTLSSTVAPAMATHWDEWSDEWGDCGYMIEWDYNIISGEYEPEYSPFEECHDYWRTSDEWGLFGPEWDDEHEGPWDVPYDHEDEDDGPFHDH
jgi:hypothetical protein